MIWQLILNLVMAYANLTVVTVIDIFVVQHIFVKFASEVNERIWQYIKPYHIAMFWVLTPYLAVLGLIIEGILCFVLTLIWVHLGAEDLLFYIYQAKIPPETYPWLWGKPKREHLLIRTIILTVMVVIAWIILKYRIVLTPIVGGGIT